MARPRKHLSNAHKQKAYRERKGGIGTVGKQRQREMITVLTLGLSDGSYEIGPLDRRSSWPSVTK